MAQSTRKILINLSAQALDKLDVLDEILYNMNGLHQGRQPAITKMSPMLIKGHEALRDLWTLLKEQL